MAQEFEQALASDDDKDESAAEPIDYMSLLQAVTALAHAPVLTFCCVEVVLQPEHRCTG